MQEKKILSGLAGSAGGAAPAAKVAHVDGKIQRHVKTQANHATSLTDTNMRPQNKSNI